MTTTVGLGGRLTYRELLIAFWAKNPGASQGAARKATGAPFRTVTHVYGQLRRSGGVFPPRFGPEGWKP